MCFLVQNVEHFMGSFDMSVFVTIAGRIIRLDHKSPGVEYLGSAQLHFAYGTSLTYWVSSLSS